MSKEKLWTKNYILLIIASFGSAMLVSFFLNTLPVYAERVSGAAAYAGLVTTVYSVAALITRPISGILAEKVSVKKLIIIGLALMTVACYSYTFAGAIAALLVIRAVHGVGFGVKSTASGVMAAEIIPKSRFAEGIGMYGLYLPVANAIGPAIGLWIIGDEQANRFDLLFGIAAVIGVMSIIIMLFIKPEHETDKQVKAEKEIVVDKSKLPKTIFGFEFGVVYPSIVLALMYFGYAAIVSFVSIYGLSKGWQGIGLFFTIGAVVLFISRLIYSKLVNKYGYHIFAIGSLLLFAITLIAIPYTNSIYVLYCLGACYGVGMGIVPMIVNTLVLERCSSQRKGTATAAYTSAMDVGMAIGSIVLGVLVDGFGFKFAFMISGVASIFAIVVYCATIMRDGHNYNFD